MMSDERAAVMLLVAYATGLGVGYLWGFVRGQLAERRRIVRSIFREAGE